MTDDELDAADAEITKAKGFKRVGRNLWRGEHYWATVKDNGRIRFSVEKPEGAAHS